MAILLATSACSDSEETSSKAPDSLGFSDIEDKPSSATSIVNKSTTTSQTAAVNTSTSQASIGSTTNTSNSINQTCSTNDYQVTIPAGWNTASSGDLQCVAFIMDTFPASLECDCTLSVKISTLQNSAADTSISLQNSAAANWNTASVLNGDAELITGDWELSEVQVGDTGQTAAQYSYLFDDGAASILITATEFHDFGGNYTFADRKAAVDELAASLNIL